MKPKCLRLGTRGSRLALWQASHVAERLRRVYQDLQIETVVISTQGDCIADLPMEAIGGKGLFTSELERALRAGEIDIAVHSLKDLPVCLADDLVLPAVPIRTNPADALVARNDSTLSSLRGGATVACSSPRRKAQLLRARPDLQIVPLRGNVDTRVRKLDDPSQGIEAIVVAWAALERLGLGARATQVFGDEVMLPAPGQGAIAVECLRDSCWTVLVRVINDLGAELETRAERAFLRALGGGCSLPVAARAELDWRSRVLRLRGRVLDPLGKEQIDVILTEDLPPEKPSSAVEGAEGMHGSRLVAERLGEEAAEVALERGAGALIEGAPPPPPQNTSLPCHRPLSNGRQSISTSQRTFLSLSTSSNPSLGMASKTGCSSPLEGKRIVNPRSPHQAEKLSALLQERGAMPLLYPCIDIQFCLDNPALHTAVSNLATGRYRWVVFSSVNSVTALALSLSERSLDLKGRVPPRVAVIGDETARAVKEHLGWGITLCPPVFTKRALLQTLTQEPPGEALVLQGDLAGTELSAGLQAAGWKVTAVECYRTILGRGGVDLPSLLRKGMVDAIALTSPSTVVNLLTRLRQEGCDLALLSQLALLSRVCLACIGPATAQAAQEHGLRVTVQAQRHTLRGLVEALEEHFAQQGSSEEVNA